jgi:hypothetical protein
MKYPKRAKIVDISGMEVLPNVIGNTPKISKPHIGKEGLAELVDDNIRITLDDGNVLWGYECWWISLEEEDECV